MFYSLMLMTITYCLAKTFQRNSKYESNLTIRKCGWIPRNDIASLTYFALSLYIILYCGLRSGYNDTHAYVMMFKQSKYSLAALLKVLSNPCDEFLFSAYNIFIKMIFGNNYVRYLTITAWITCGSYLMFFRKYSSDFPMLVFLMIASTFLNFSYAALRQCLAIAVAIWAIPQFIRKKIVKGVLILLVAMFIHKLVMLYIVAIFLMDDVWTKKSALIVFGTFAVGSAFSLVFNEVAEITGYSTEYLVESAGTNVLRTLVWLVPVVLSFIYRNEINRNSNKTQKMFINLSLIGSMIMILATFGGANLIGRTAYYFYPFFAISFSEIIRPEIMRGETKQYRSLCMIGFFAYFVVLSWTGFGNFFFDRLQHNSIVALLKSYY